MQLNDNNKYSYITGCATASLSTQVDTGQGSLILITVGCASGSEIEVTDGSPGASGSPNMNGIQAGATGTQWYLAQYVNGLKITTGATVKATIIYRPNNH